MKTVVVHRGARDSYEVARALSKAGELDRLVTDLAWNPDSVWNRFLPGSLRKLMECRNPRVANREVRSTIASGLLSLAFEKAHLPFSWKRSATRWNDGVLGRTAGKLATRNHSALLSYSYYAYSAFQAYRGTQARILFQAHPHPLSVRNILRRELEEHPECAESLLKEWELSLDEEDFQRLVAETRMPDTWITASTFTRETLIENGVHGTRVHVAPYGVDLAKFQPGHSLSSKAGRGPLRLLFVGRINQRKGVRYLLEAMRCLRTDQLELRVCGRVVDDLRLFRELGSRVRITPNVSSAELIEAYQQADLFVLPSVVEGFGQVLLESMACGLPVLSTTRTAAPDLVREGQDGFVVDPCRSDVLAGRIEWALSHRRDLFAMREAARSRAECFAWSRFRERIVKIVRDCDRTTAAVADFARVGS